MTTPTHTFASVPVWRLPAGGRGASGGARIYRLDVGRRTQDEGEAGITVEAKVDIVTALLGELCTAVTPQAPLRFRAFSRLEVLADRAREARISMPWRETETRGGYGLEAEGAPEVVHRLVDTLWSWSAELTVTIETPGGEIELRMVPDHLDVAELRVPPGQRAVDAIFLPVVGDDSSS